MDNVTNLVPWEQKSPATVELTPEIVKRYICPNATDQEVYFFLQLCKAQQLNPFLKEIYLIKYGNQPAAIVTGKETFTKRASRIESYAGFKAGIIVLTSKDVVYREGSFYLKDKEVLVGGWAEVYRVGLSTPIRAEVALEEYIQRKTDGQVNRFWAEKPATMIRKVAIVQALREAFPEEFGGLYSPEEMPVNVDKLPEYDMSKPALQRQPTKEPQRASAQNSSTPAPDDFVPHVETRSARDVLHEELAAYCQLETTGEIDMDMYRAVLAECSRFTGKDKQGREKVYEMTDVFAENVSDKWIGSTLRKLREKLGTNGKKENDNG